MNIEDLGFDDWFRSSLPHPAAEPQVARVVAVDRDRCVIRNAHGSVPAEIAGRLSYCAETAEAMPCVGDWVRADYYDRDQHAVVHDVLARRTFLRRKCPGAGVDYQPIAANVDVAFIVQSCDVDYNLNRLDRYLAVAADGGVRAALLLTKCDLASNPHLESIVADVRREHPVDVIPLSATTGVGCAQFKNLLEKRKTYCLVGSSGVGKTTLLNTLLGREEFVTCAVQENGGRGRHATTRRQLVVLDCGAIFIDTPGMRELGMLAFGVGIDSSFADITAISGMCRFANCTHVHEKDCAVISSVANGELSGERYRSYLKLIKESRYYEMSQREKRQKDKAFGKMKKNHATHQDGFNSQPG